MTKVALKDYDVEYTRFVNTINKAKTLTEKKRYYYSNYGFSNFAEVVLGKTDKLIKDKENYDKHYLTHLIDWWKKKASNRFENLKKEHRIRKEIEVWTTNKNLDIIR